MSLLPSRSIVRATILAVLLVAASCKKLEQVDVPGTSPNPPVGTLPSPVPGGTVTIGISTPTPSPAPSSSPSGSPATSPTAAPGPSTSPSAGSCSLAAMPEGSPCRAESPSFQAQVEAAQADVLRTRPDLFDGNRVRSEDAYVQEVARVLRTRGLCAAQGGPKDEIAVKTSNDWNDQYDIVLGSGQTWTSYQVTCRPSRF
jgi:hypothetical protein